MYSIKIDFLVVFFSSLFFVCELYFVPKKSRVGKKECCDCRERELMKYRRFRC